MLHLLWREEAVLVVHGHRSEFEGGDHEGTGVVHAPATPLVATEVGHVAAPHHGPITAMKAEKDVRGT